MASHGWCLSHNLTTYISIHKWHKCKQTIDCSHLVEVHCRHRGSCAQKNSPQLAPVLPPTLPQPQAQQLRFGMTWLKCHLQQKLRSSSITIRSFYQLLDISGLSGLLVVTSLQEQPGPGNGVASPPVAAPPVVPKPNVPWTMTWLDDVRKPASFQHLSTTQAVGQLMSTFTPKTATTYSAWTVKIHMIVPTGFQDRCRREMGIDKQW